MIATGLGWLALFVAYSFQVFDQWLPPYYVHEGGFEGSTWWIGLAAQWVSPSRGLFVYVPWLGLVGYGLVAYRGKLGHRGLAAAALLAFALHSCILSGNANWWGGSSYGPRFYTDLVPLFVLLGILALRAALDRVADGEPRARPSARRQRIELVALAACLVMGTAIHGAGALSPALEWNRTVAVNRQPMRVFDWRWPQWACAMREHTCRAALTERIARDAS